MKYQLRLYYYDYCPFCIKVLKVIKKLNLQVEKCNTMDNPEYLEKLRADTGRQTVPCLYINEMPMHESDDIIAWLYEHVDELEKK